MSCEDIALKPGVPALYPLQGTMTRSPRIPLPSYRVNDTQTAISHKVSEWAICWLRKYFPSQKLQRVGRSKTLTATYVPCNSGSKGGCWAPYTCWMLGKQGNKKLAFLSPSSTESPTLTESRKAPVPRPQDQEKPHSTSNYTSSHPGLRVNPMRNGTTQATPPQTG